MVAAWSSWRRRTNEQPASRLSRRRDRRKAEIVRVAIEMLATSGYQGMSLEGVAERTDIAKATLYHYFSQQGRAGGRGARGAHRRGSRAAHRRARRGGIGIDSRAAASARAQQLHVLTVEFPEVGSIFSWQSTWPAAHDEARKSMRRRHDAIFREVVGAGLAAGELDCDDVDVALQCHHAVMNSVSVWLGRIDDPTERTAQTDGVVRAVMRIFTTADDNEQERPT